MVLPPRPRRSFCSAGSRRCTGCGTSETLAGLGSSFNIRFLSRVYGKVDEDSFGCLEGISSQIFDSLWDTVRRRMRFPRARLGIGVACKLKHQHDKGGLRCQRLLRQSKCSRSVPTSPGPLKRHSPKVPLTHTRKQLHEPSQAL